jgi:3,4-dihydroxy-2-butanone 4-phosphate synthase
MNRERFRAIAEKAQQGSPGHIRALREIVDGVIRRQGAPEPRMDTIERWAEYIGIAAAEELGQQIEPAAAEEADRQMLLLLGARMTQADEEQRKLSAGG